MISPETRQDLFSRANRGTQPYVENPPLFVKNNTNRSAYSNNVVEETLFGNETQELNNQMNNSATLNPELLPSQQTMNLTRENDAQVKVADGIRLNTQGKVLLASFGVVVLALILAITLAAISISATTASVAIINEEIAAKVAELSQLEESLAALEEAARIESVASGILGLQYPTESQIVYFKLLEANAAQLNTPANWFDSLCNWLSGLLG